MDEDALIEVIAERFRTDDSELLLGIGDDAAVLARNDEHQVLSVDVAVENVHFRREWLGFDELGHRSVIAAVSDLAAMGARVRAFLVSLILPRGFSDSDAVLRLIDGLRAGANEAGAAIVGGNLSRGRELSITTTVVGSVGNDFPIRSGAKPGDRIYVSGTIGEAALGLRLLMRGTDKRQSHDELKHDETIFVQKWKRPTSRLEVGKQLRTEASSAIDISDGLLRDLSRLLNASGVGGAIELSKFTVGSDFRRVSERIGSDPWELVLSGGEDYELLFTAPDSATIPVGCICIGTCVDSGISILDEEGVRREVGPLGFSHF